MKNIVAPTKNVVAMQVAMEVLTSRDPGVPGMCLVHGVTGMGKTTAVTLMINRFNAVYVRATSQWTPSTMLGRVMVELGAAPMQRRQAMLDFIVDELQGRQRPLFVDEADYLVRNADMLEALRDIHDLSGQPVVMVGMEGIEKRLVHHKQLTRRISQWVEFLPSDLDDARRVTAATCEVPLDDELQEALHRAADGSIGQMVVGLARIEAQAKANAWPVATAELWGERRFFIGAKG